MKMIKTTHTSQTGRNVPTLAGFILVLLAIPAQAQQFSAWSAPEHLPAPINTASTDGCPFISKDGLSIFFATNRTVQSGHTDIFVSWLERNDDPWAPPVGLDYIFI